MSGAERRRTERVLLTIPLRVLGQDAEGRPFESDARTIFLNRDGARLQSKRPLAVGQIISLFNNITMRSGRFRVVGPTEPYAETGGEWGVEALDKDLNFWGIRFPPLAAGEGIAEKALLECRICHEVVLLQVSLVEIEVLDTAGIISKACVTCEAVSPWGYPEKQVAMEGPAEEAAMLEEVRAQAEAKGKDLRRHRRVSLQMPLLVRDYYGGGEIGKTENVSKTGLCFASDKNYFIGQGVIVACPYSTSGQSVEVRARIVRRRELLGTERRIYGVRYDPRTS